MLIPDGKKIIRGGGADGSIIVFSETELRDPGNVGIDDILGEVSPFFFKHANAITPGDLWVLLKTTFRFSTRLTLCAIVFNSLLPSVLVSVQARLKLISLWDVHHRQDQLPQISSLSRLTPSTNF